MVRKLSSFLAVIGVFREYRHDGALNGSSRYRLGRIPAPASRALDFEKEHALRLLQAAEGDWALAAC